MQLQDNDGNDCDAWSRQGIFWYISSVVVYFGIFSEARRTLVLRHSRTRGAKLEDYPDPSSTTDLGRRLRRSSGWVGKYRASLIHEQVIEAAGHGKVVFAIPHFGEWLQGQR